MAKGGRKKPMTRSSRADLIFPVGRVARYLRQGRYADRFSGLAAVALAACLESLVFEIFDMAVEVVYTKKKKRIFPVHIH